MLEAIPQDSIMKAANVAAIGLNPLISMFTKSNDLSMIICSVIAGLVSGIVRAVREKGVQYDK